MRALPISILFLCACGTSGAAPDASTDAAAEASAPRANGTVVAWQTLAPLPHARANFCATVVGSFVVTIGGNYASDGGFTKLDEIDVARFHDDGSLDAWQVAGHAPSPVTECTAAALGNTLYVLDGIYDDTAKQGHVFSADLASDGTLGVLADSGTLPAGVDLFDDLGFATDTVWSTYSALDGTCDLVRLGGGPLPFLNEFRGRPQWASAVAGGATFAYVLGGYGDADAGNVVETSGAGAKVTGTTIASPVAVDDLPKPTTFGMAASADDWVFVVGGRDAIFGSQPRADVIAGQADATGHLGGWTAQPSLPAARSNACAVVAGNFLYVLGGADTSAVDTVYAAQVRF